MNVCFKRACCYIRSIAPHIGKERRLRKDGAVRLREAGEDRRAHGLRQADVQQARNFVTNKLVAMADCGDPKLELKALELLGKHSDIGLFTERSEITVHHTSSSSLEASIKERVKRLMNAEVTDVLPLDDLDAHLGPMDAGEFEKETTGEETHLPKENTTDTVEDIEEKTAVRTENQIKT